MAIIDNLESPLTQALKTTLPSVAAHIATQLNERRLRQQQAVGLQAALGIHPDKATALSNLDPQTLAAYVKQEVQRPNRERNANLLRQIMGGGNGSETGNLPTNAVTPQSTMQQGQMFDIPPEVSDNDLRFFAEQFNQKVNRELKIRENEKNRELQREKMKFQAEEKGRGRELQSFLQRQKLEAAESQQKRALTASEAKEKRAALRENVEKVRIRNKELDTAIESNKAMEKDLEELIALNATGQLIQGKSHVALEALGWDKFFTNVPSQIAAKDIERMGADLMKSNKTGSKMTNDIFNSLKATLPSLRNSKEGFDALARSVKGQTRINRLLDEAEKRINNKYVKQGIEVPLTMVRDEAAMEIAPEEARINRERSKIIGNAMVKSNPILHDMLKDLPSGTKKRLNGQVIEKVGRDWILLPNYQSDIKEGI